MSSLFDLGDDCDDPYEDVGAYDTSDPFIDDDHSEASTELHRSNAVRQRKRKLSSLAEEETLFIGQRKSPEVVQQIADRSVAAATTPDAIPGVSAPGKRLKKGTFRCKNQRLLLTYAQVGVGFNTEPLVDALERLGAVHRLGRELHKDGGIHYHCYVDFGRPFEFENCHKFCHGGPPSAGCPTGGHCHIRVVRRTPHYAWDYVGKDGDVVSENCPRPLVVKGQSERKAEWVYCLDATDFNNFYERVKEVDPASLVKSSTSVEHCAKRLFRQRKPQTSEPVVGLEFHWESFPKVAEWVLRVLPQGGERLRRLCPSFSDADELRLRAGSERQLVGGRRPSLILWGASLHGKTDLARSLGKHVHFGSDFSLADLLAVGVENVDFGVLDDLDWTDPILKGNKYKAWLGCQEHFICTDKYLRKESIQWGKPCIFLSNDNPTESLKHSDFLWIQKNCWVVEVPDGTRIASRPSIFE